MKFLLRFKLLVTIVFFSIYTTTNAQIYISLKDRSESVEPKDILPIRTIDKVGNDLIVTYEFKNAYLKQDELYANTYWWNIDAFGFNETLTQPAVPLRTDRIEIPSATQAKLELIATEYSVFNCRLTPAREPLTESLNETYTFDNVPPIAVNDLWYPNDIITNNGIHQYRGVDILNVLLSPVQYNSALGQVRAYTKLIYKVSFVNNTKVQSSPSNQPVISHEDCYLSNITLNHKNENYVSANAIANEMSYLIITSNKYASAVTEFCKWKKLLGFKTFTSIRESWTSDEVKNEIKSAYNYLGDLYYVLIIGDIEDVPSNNSTLLYNHVTDFYYGCLDGDHDQIQDVLIGRISVCNEDEALSTLNKIIKYEKEPVSNNDFYTNALHCAYFQDDDKNGYADLRFAQTCEDVRNYVMQKGKKITRIYSTESDVYPTNWALKDFANGEPIPADLHKPEFPWNGTRFDITQGINSGAFYILHRDHGSILGWGDPAFKITDVNDLTNSNLLPIVFSINCQTGKFDSKICFAESFLRNPNGGCVGIFGATDYSFSGYNDVLTGGMFDAIWPEPGLIIKMPYQKGDLIKETPKAINRLGQILQQGLSRMSEITTTAAYVKYTKEIFHCFGDPSMFFPAYAPSDFNTVEGFYDLDYIHVSVGNDKATITFYDEKTESIDSYIASSATYKTSNPENIIVCISALNKIPVIMRGNDVLLFQNKTVDSDIDITANKVMIGSRITSSKESGPVNFKDGKITIKTKSAEIEPNTTVSNSANLTIFFN